MQDNTENDKQHTFETNKKYYIISIYTVVVVLICALLVKMIFSWASTSAFIMKYVSAATPVIAGVFIAYLLNPLANFLDRKAFSGLLKKTTKKDHPKISRTISIIGSYVIVIGLLALVIGFLIPQLISSAAELVGLFQTWYSQSGAWIENLQERFPDIDITGIMSNIQTSISSFLNVDRITSIVSNMVPKLFSTGVAVFKVAYNVLFSLIVSLYALFDKDRLVRNLKRLIRAIFKPAKAASAIDIVELTHHIFCRFIVGKTADSIIIGCLCFMFMSIFKLPFALIISVIVGITNMVPYVGPYVGAVPGFFIIFITSPIKSVIYLLMILAIQMFDGLVLGPKILGDSTGLRPMWIIFAISVGGAAGGVLGMFLGVPTVGVIAALLDRWVDARIKKNESEALEEAHAEAVGQEEIKSETEIQEE